MRREKFVQSLGKNETITLTFLHFLEMKMERRKGGGTHIGLYAQVDEESTSIEILVLGPALLNAYCKVFKPFLNLHPFSLLKDISWGKGSAG